MANRLQSTEYSKFIASKDEAPKRILEIIPSPWTLLKLTPTKVA